MTRFQRMTTYLAASMLASGIASAAQARWITSWAAGSIPPSAKSASFSNQTLRQIVRLSAGGDALRVRFTNAFGAEPLTDRAA